MGNFLTIFSTVVQMVPMLVGMVHAAEALFPGKGAGPTKLDLVLNTVQGAMVAGATGVVGFEQLKPALTSTVNSIVSAYNATGGVPLAASVAQVAASALPQTNAPVPAAV